MSTPISRSLSPSQSTEDPPLFIPYNYETTPTPPMTDIVSVAVSYTHLNKTINT